MKDNDTDKVKYNQLLERVKELEQENEQIAERAEEVLLLNALAESISTLDNLDELIEELLEKISIFKFIPLCCCYEVNGIENNLVAYYTAAPLTGSPSKIILFDEEVIHELDRSGVYCFCPKNLIQGKFPISINNDTEVIVISFLSKRIGKGVFLFMDERNEYSLSTKIMIIQQAIQMVLSRIEKLEYTNQIEQLNYGLEQRVVARTKELVQINTRLRMQIEERKLVEEELRLAKDKAQESDKLKSFFLANMSHEIRTPMNAIVGFSELMESGECETAELRDYSRLIYSNSLSLLNLINDLLDFSKIEANQLLLHCSVCNVNDILDDVSLLGDSLLKQYKKEKLNIKISKSLSNKKAAIFSDEFRLKQILLNLLSNAIKFSFNGTIQISYTSNDDKIFFSVQDKGIGIQEDMHKLIFNRFSRGADDINKPIAGNGLGLTITKTLVEMLGGEISVDSTLGIGSDFSFSVLKSVSCSNNCS